MIIGLDVGGTNIDAVIIKDREIISKVKMPHDKSDLLNSILNVIDKLLDGHDKSEIKRINLSTTISTNAVVKKELSKVGMLIQSGPGLNVEPLAYGDEIKFIDGSTDHRGRIVKNLDINELEKDINEFKEKNMETVGVVTKFSTRNSSHEKKIEELTRDKFEFTTMGHNISGKLNFPRRMHTTYLNSAVHNAFNLFASDIKSSLEQRDISAPIYVLKADGGTMDLASAEDKPVETVLSGPAASFMGINALIPKESDGIFLDIGGTTTDIFFLIDGVPVFEPLGITIDKYKTLVRSLYSVSIGLGGDSSIEVKDGELVIESKDGNNPSPTDAMIVLGLIEDGDRGRANKKMEKLGEELDLSVKEVSEKVLDIMGDIIKAEVDRNLKEINNKPVYTVKEVLHGRVIKPEFINVIGGPAKNLANVLEDKFNLPCIYPKEYHVANAIGAALAKPTMDITLTADTERKIVSVPELSLYEVIKGRYDLDSAKEQAINLLKKNIKTMYSDEEEMNDEDFEIIDASSFNMVDGFFTTGKNIRVEAQVKPGLIYELRSENKND